MEGFLSQRGNFTFEIIVNDDCSSDGTTEILLEYERRYPGIVKVITHRSNHRGFIDGVSATRYIIENIAKGDYIALCEGDDYWISPVKLATQYDYLEAHQDCNICIHNAYIVDYSHNLIYLSEPRGVDRDKHFGDIVTEGGGKINPTASFFFRKGSYGTWLPGPVGDHFTIMSVAQGKDVHWLSDPMSVYRFKTKGSWSSRDELIDSDGIFRYRDAYIEALKSMNRQYEFKFDSFFQTRIEIQDQDARCRHDLAMYQIGRVGLFRLFQRFGLRTSLKGLLSKHSRTLFHLASNLELLMKAMLTRTLVSRSVSCDAIRPLAVGRNEASR